MEKHERRKGKIVKNGEKKNTDQIMEEKPN
jgi:hypothetical protein